MIVLDRIDPRERRIAWAATNSDLPGARHETEVDWRLKMLGVTTHGPFGRESTSRFEHAWRITPGQLDYSMRVPHADLVPHQESFYLAACLATVSWAQSNDLLSVHLALYELLVNVHDHGRPLANQASTLSLDITVTSSAVEGVLRDGCERFHPRVLDLAGVGGRVQRRERRGYGLTIVERALDGLTRDFGPTGNVVRFRKELGA